MGVGPVELILIAFHDGKFEGRIAAELKGVLDKGLIRLIDGVFITKDAGGVVTFIDVSPDGDDEIARLGAMMDKLTDLMSDEDIVELAAGLEPGDAALALLLEHTWAKGFQQAVVDAGGVMIENMRIPGVVVDELLVSLEEAEKV